MSILSTLSYYNFSHTRIKKRAKFSILWSNTSEHWSCALSFQILIIAKKDSQGLFSIKTPCKAFNFHCLVIQSIHKNSLKRCWLQIVLVRLCSFTIFERYLMWAPCSWSNGLNRNLSNRFTNKQGKGLNVNCNRYLRFCSINLTFQHYLLC